MCVEEPWIGSVPEVHHKRTTDGSDLGVIYPNNRARPYLRVCFHFVDHRSAKFYGNQEITCARGTTNKTNFPRLIEVISGLP